MKKYVVLVLAILMLVFLLSACSGDAVQNENSIENSATSREEPTDDSSKEEVSFVTDRLVNDDGVEFTPNIETKGVIQSGAASVNSKIIVLNGKSYDFPVRVSELLNNGWFFSPNITFENSFEGNMTTSLASLDLYYGELDGVWTKINIGKIYNDFADTKGIEDCLLVEIGMNYYDFSTASRDGMDYVLPGGITKKSTAADVLSILGSPNNTSDFRYGYNLQTQLSYFEHKETGWTYHFTFQDDGSLYSTRITMTTA